MAIASPAAIDASCWDRRSRNRDRRATIASRPSPGSRSTNSPRPRATPATNARRTVGPCSTIARPSASRRVRPSVRRWATSSPARRRRGRARPRPRAPRRRPRRARDRDPDDDRRGHRRVGEGSRGCGPGLDGRRDGQVRHAEPDPGEVGLRGIEEDGHRRQPGLWMDRQELRLATPPRRRRPARASGTSPGWRSAGPDTR